MSKLQGSPLRDPISAFTIEETKSKEGKHLVKGHKARSRAKAATNSSIWAFYYTRESKKGGKKEERQV